jgi:hypothetical protein
VAVAAGLLRRSLAPSKEFDRIELSLAKGISSGRCRIRDASDFNTGDAEGDWMQLLLPAKGGMGDVADDKIVFDILDIESNGEQASVGTADDGIINELASPLDPKRAAALRPVRTALRMPTVTISLTPTATVESSSFGTMASRRASKKCKPSIASMLAK